MTFRNSLGVLAPTLLLLAGCDAFNAVGEGVEEEMAKQQADADAAAAEVEATEPAATAVKDAAAEPPAAAH